jgi:peptidyl-prolyl cis-trans isomerase A (cyclophilin A)
MRNLGVVGVMSIFLVTGLLAAQQPPPAKTPPAGAGEAKAAETRAPGLYMTFQTDKGDIGCKLFENEAPLTVRKIVGLAIGKISYVDPRTGQTVRKRFYDGLIFHRVIPGFMIQGGDPLGTGMGGPGGPGFPFKDEFAPALKFDVAGRLAMANSGPNTNGSQFFITDAPTPHLNNHHTIFGQCGNADVVRAITRVPRNQDDRPTTPVHIKHVAVERVGPAPPDAPEAMPAGKAPAKSAGKKPAKSSP